MTAIDPCSNPSAPIGAALFRQVFRRHAAGVAVVTADAGRGPAGVTVTSLASLSVESPLLSFSISATASAWPHLRDAGTAVMQRRPGSPKPATAATTPSRKPTREGTS